MSREAASSMGPETGQWVNFALRCVAALVALVFAQWVLVPGFLALDVPSHSDLWRYYATAHDMPLRTAVVSPRPLMVVALHVLSVIESPRLFFFVLNLPAVLFVASLSMAAGRFTRLATSHVVFFLLCLMIFGTPTFYELNPLDYGGLLSGVFFAFEVLLLCHARDRATDGDPLKYWALVAGSALLGYLSFETKPTFAALIPLAPIVLCERYSARKIMGVCGACAGVIVLSVAKDVLLKSPFIDVSDGASPYKVGTSPVIVLEAASFYVRKIFIWPLIPIAAFGMWRAWRHGRMMFCVTLLAPILAVLPMCAIPSRLLEMYSWYGTAVLGVLLASLFSVRGQKWVRWIASVLVVIGFAAGVMGADRKGREAQWTISNHLLNSATLRGLEALQSRITPRERILVTGTLGPFSPFNNDRFIATTTPVRFSWNVAYPPAREALVRISHDSALHIPRASVDFRAYDRVAIFGAGGELAELRPASEFLSMPDYDIALLFYCRDGLDSKDQKLPQALECLNQFGEYAAAESYGQRMGESSGNQWVWYWTGRASEALGHSSEAFKAYEKAASIERAAVFVDAAERVKGG
ncbi:hypothetical protein IM816_14465 [Luteibacter flocculans]|uniref:Dolichyl-phosphate-mannose-protein mannosyltransferase n=1 Tax=Luteibacter flocculans TaxID=2780091 RepID=A0ABY4T4H5_9GAMM|nr:hypothetical protein [Luteibacter flocculans]URL57804.1 hypothetical protein IM816_14465 [Luteibacter flocculans]